MAKKTQKADVRQQFELARVLLSIIPKLNLTTGEFLQLVKEPKKLEEILGSIFQVNPVMWDIPRLKNILRNAFGIEFLPEVRRLLESKGYEVVDLPKQPIFEYSLGERLGKEVGGRGFLEEDERFEQLFHSAEEVAWMPNDPLVPNTTGESDFLQKIELGKFSELIQEETLGWAKAVLPNLETATYLLKVHYLATEEYVLSSLLTRVSNFWDRRAVLVVGMFDDQMKSPLVDIRDFLVREDNLGILRLIVPC